MLATELLSHCWLLKEPFVRWFSAESKLAIDAAFPLPIKLAVFSIILDYCASMVWIAPTCIFV